MNVLLGIWLFVSAFIWRHSPSQFTNAWTLGIIAIVASLLALSVPAVRFVNTLLGAWLVISAWALPRVTGGTAWNDVIVGAAIFIVSLVGPRTSVASGARLQRTA